MNWLKLSNRTLYSLILLVALIGTTSAQNTWQEYKKMYPDFNELVLNDSQVYAISIEDKKLKIIQDNYIESIILSENGIQNNRESFAYSDLMQLKSYDAYTLSTTAGKERKYKVTQSNVKQASESTVFYSDVKERNLIFPNLETGARKIYQYQIEVVDPFLLHKFVFGSGLPIVNSSIEIKTAKGINLGYKIFNDPNQTIVFSKTEKKGGWIYKWTLKNCPPLKHEENSPGFLYTIPNINIYIKDYTVNDNKIDMLDDVGKLYKYYKGYTENLNKSEDPVLKGITEEITANKTSDAEKIKSILYWVKDNIKYIAFENGYEGFIPREAGLVCERKFGDCKDMASIISSMAKYAHVPNVAIAWIGTRSIPYSYAELSTPGVDDHMIAVFRDNDNYVFLDATDKETRYGLPSAFIQGKEVLFEENENYKLVRVPIVASDQNEIKQQVNLTIENDMLLGSGTIQYNGLNRSDILSQIGDASDKARFELIKSCVIKGNNKFNLKDFKEINSSNRDLPYQIDFKFDLANYIVKVDKDIYINLFLDKYFEGLTIEKDRMAKYDFDFLSAANNQYELEIPKNLTVQYLPKNFHLDNALVKAAFEFDVKNNKIHLNVHVLQRKLILDTIDFELWNESIKKIKSAYLETIILSEKK